LAQSCRLSRRYCVLLRGANRGPAGRCSGAAGCSRPTVATADIHRSLDQPIAESAPPPLTNRIPLCCHHPPSLPMNISGTLNVFRLIRDPSLCLPQYTASTFNHLPVPLSKAFLPRKDGKEVDIRAVVLDKDNCFAIPHTNEVHKPYHVSSADPGTTPGVGARCVEHVRHWAGGVIAKPV
jgi:hypothetical protein